MRSALVLVDGSHAAAGAVQRAAELALREDGRLTLMYVVTPARSAGAGPYLVGIPEESEDVARKRLLRLSTAAPKGVPVHTILRRGRVADEIVRRAAAADHDMIVIGSSSRRVPFIGECVSCRVRRRSAIPVITVGSSGRQERCCHRFARQA